MILSTNYNPDVLTCLANLSNDEVFTPPQVVNRMLDMLPLMPFALGIICTYALANSVDIVLLQFLQ